MKKNLAPKLHPQNLHQGRYDLEQLMEVEKGLREFVFTNDYGNQTLDFANPEAVKSLNRALLKTYYRIDFWDIPAGFLCPPIPGRADYIHYLADLLKGKNGGKLPLGSRIKVLDIGTGANLIYPIIGSGAYDWAFVGSELNEEAYQFASQIIQANSRLKAKVELRRQINSAHIFTGIIQPEEFFDLTLCNPPFHESAAAAQEGSLRKVRNLTGKNPSKAELNFGGQASELWTKGGEWGFIQTMVLESLKFKNQVFWFTTLVSKSEHLKSIQNQLEKVGAREVKTVEMAQGNKISRFVAWTFLDQNQQKFWVSHRWK